MHFFCSILNALPVLSKQGARSHPVLPLQQPHAEICIIRPLLMLTWHARERRKGNERDNRDSPGFGISPYLHTARYVNTTSTPAHQNTHHAPKTTPVPPPEVLGSAGKAHSAAASIVPPPTATASGLSHKNSSSSSLQGTNRHTTNNSTAVGWCGPWQVVHAARLFKTKRYGCSNVSILSFDMREKMTGK